eukprot:78145_1
MASSRGRFVRFIVSLCAVGFLYGFSYITYFQHHGPDLYYDIPGTMHLKHIIISAQSPPSPLPVVNHSSDASATTHRISTHPRPDYPALVLQGPPKCGTRTFVNTLSRYNDVVQYGPERDFWAGPNDWRCLVNWNPTQWSVYLKQYAAHNATLYTIATSMTEDKRHYHNSFCTAKRYRWHWNKIKNNPNNFIYSKWIHKSCQHPNESLSVYSKYTRYCYLIEKGPVYSRAPRVGIYYAYWMPKIKLITIIRNPLKQIVSSIFAFPEVGFRPEHRPMIETYYTLVTRFQSDEAFMNFSAMCSDLNGRWNQLELDGESGRDRYLRMRKEYRNFLVIYYWKRYVEQLFMVDPRMGIFKWSGFILPSLLTAWTAWDEVKGETFMENEWDPLGNNEVYQSKVIQFEWMFDNIAKAMKEIKCWMMDIRTDAGCDDEIDDKENEKLFENVEHLNVNRPSSWKEYNEYYESNMQRLWNPCNMALQNIVLRDRPQLLLGGWQDWNYTFV